MRHDEDLNARLPITITILVLGLRFLLFTFGEQVTPLYAIEVKNILEHRVLAFRHFMANLTTSEASLGCPLAILNLMWPKASSTLLNLRGICITMRLALDCTLALILKLYKHRFLARPGS